MKNTLLLFLAYFLSPNINADTMLPQDISNEDLLKYSTCIIVGTIRAGNLDKYDQLTVAIKPILKSKKCQQKEIIEFRAEGRAGYNTFPTIGRIYLVALTGEESPYWLYHSINSVIEVAKFETGLLSKPEVVDFFKSDKVPLQSFIEAHGYIWNPRECDSSLTYFGIVEPCDRSTEVLSFFLKAVQPAI